VDNSTKALDTARKRARAGQGSLKARQPVRVRILVAQNPVCKKTSPEKKNKFSFFRRTH